MSLSGRTILITGASSGIGRATAILLSQLGARLILAGRNKERLDQTAGQLEGADHRVEAFDLTGIDEVPRWIKGITSREGALDGLVHSAGMHVTRPLRFLSDETVQEVMSINFGAALALAKGLRQKGAYNAGASIVFLSSVMGLVGQPGVSVYAASKGAIVAVTKSLALELARDGLRVNCVAPAQVKTEMAEAMQETLSAEQIAAIEAMHPLGIGTPLDVAYAIAFLLADTGRWITGTTLVVDGGYTAH